MRCLAAALAAFALAPSAAAQAPARPPTVAGTVDLGAAVQRYTLGEDAAPLRQATVPVGVAVRHASGVGGYVRAVYVAVSGDDAAELAGLADVQLGASLRRAVGGGAVEASLGLSLPAGGGTLTPAEFSTATAIALDDYAFDVPSLGQGAAVSPGLTLVAPLGAGAAVGVGVAHTLRGAYAPFADDDAEYAPADETLLTGGVDARIGRASTFALDVTAVLYGADEFGGRTFEPGTRLAATARWAWGGGLVRGRLLARYRHLFDGAVALGETAAARPVVDLRPSQAVLAGGLSLVRNGTGAELSAGVRYYGVIRGTDDVLDVLEVLGEQQVLVDVGLSPTVALGGGLRARATVVYTRGVAEAAGAPPFSGLRVGGGLEASF